MLQCRTWLGSASMSSAAQSKAAQQYTDVRDLAVHLQLAHHVVGGVHGQAQHVVSSQEVGRGSVSGQHSKQ
eukprot:1147896-Pelagomonas_calceolata.AAC.2